MGKEPVAGFAKTRLIPALGAEGAARLAGAMTRDVLGVVREAVEGSGWGWEVWVGGMGETGGIGGGETGDVFGRERAEGRVRAQGGGGLGERLRAALSGGGIAVGTDAPTITVGVIRAAMEALEQVDCCFAPALDGGYVLVGVRDSDGIFEGVEWSTDRTLETQLAQAAELGRSVRLLDRVGGGAWLDIDEPEDLVRLKTELSQPGTAPKTHRFLKTLPIR